MYGMKTYTFEEVKDFLAIDSLQQQVLRLSLVNLVLVAVVGLVLRTLPFLPDLGIVYKNVLHGHSHFVFGGCVMPVLFGAACATSMISIISQERKKSQNEFAYWRTLALSNNHAKVKALTKPNNTRCR